MLRSLYYFTWISLTRILVQANFLAFSILGAHGMLRNRGLFELYKEKNKSCVTQDKTVYLAKAKFILTRNGHSQINTVYCVNM